MHALPRMLAETMSEEIAYNAFRDGGYVRNLPAYVEGSYYFPEECGEEFRHMGDQLRRDVFWNAVADAHDVWRSLPEIKALILDENCANDLNVFARSELAGLEAFLVWTRRLERWFRLAGFDFDKGFNNGDFGAQLAWVQENHWDVPSVVAGTFLENRRRFAEDSELVDQRDLYQYVTNASSNVLGVCAWCCDEPQEAHTVKIRVLRMLYTDDNDSLAYRLTRQILLANGGEAPINW